MLQWKKYPYYNENFNLFTLIKSKYQFLFLDLQILQNNYWNGEISKPDNQGL